MSREENPQENLHDLSELEAALAALVPRAEHLNRDRLMFLAGQASTASKIGQPVVEPPAARSRRRAGWAWPAAFAAMTGVAASLLVALAIRPAPQITERIVERIITAPAPSQEPAAEVAQGRVEPNSTVDPPAMLAALPDWLTWGLFPRPDVATSASHPTRNSPTRRSCTASSRGDCRSLHRPPPAAPRTNPSSIANS